MAFRRRNKSYPFFSQEFLIQNHADIVFSLVIFILIGLMFEVSLRLSDFSFLSSLFLSQLFFLSVSLTSAVHIKLTHAISTRTMRRTKLTLTST